MKQWQAYYCDGKHNLDCIIENNYGDNDTEHTLKMCIDGVAFYGMDFDDWELSENESAANIDRALNKFLLFKYGSKEAGYRFMLQSYTLSIKIPTYSYCQEVGLCDKFIPRVNCLGGYRGLIYT
jgi:hypothetical protein